MTHPIKAPPPPPPHLTPHPPPIIYAVSVHRVQYAQGRMKSLPPASTIRIVVVADSDASISTQLTWTPFRPVLTGLTVMVDVSGWVESLEKVNLVELTITGGGTPLDPPAVTIGVKGIWAPVTLNSHLRNIPVTLHVSSSWSPTWQTGATPEGEISTNPGEISEYHWLAKKMAWAFYLSQHLWLLVVRLTV